MIPIHSRTFKLRLPVALLIAAASSRVRRDAESGSGLLSAEHRTPDHSRSPLSAFSS
jgi:hypothetical protein